MFERIERPYRALDLGSQRANRSSPGPRLQSDLPGSPDKATRDFIPVRFLKARIFPARRSRSRMSVAME